MINYNGELIPKNSFYLNATNRAFSSGDALVEVVRTVPERIFFWEDHYLRLMASMRILRMEIPMSFTMEYLQDQVFRTLQESRLHEDPAYARITVFRKSGRGNLPANNEVSYIIETEKLDAPFYILDADTYGIDLYKDHYVTANMLSNLSTTNKILQTVGSIYANENGYQDCLLINESKNVVQAINGNIFLVKDDLVKTPPLNDGCENGIIRKKIIEIIGKVDAYTMEVVSISPFELQKADELFITNITKGIQPVTTYRKANFKKNAANDLLGKLNALARLA